MASTDDPGQPKGQVTVAAEVIAEGDRLARQITYPNSFAADAVGENALIKFMGDRNPDGSFSESLVLERMTSEAEIHKRGCEAARSKNAKIKAKREQKGMVPADPVSGEDRVYYCGFTTSTAAPLKLVRDRYFVELLVEEDKGFAAHVAVYIRPADASTKLKEADKTEAGRLLARNFGDPKPHVCPEDETDQHHPVNNHGADVLILKDAA